MKLFLSVILFLALTNNALANTLIQNCDDLLSVPNKTKETYVLAMDINCAGYKQTKAIDFHGEIDGQGYRITGLTIDYEGRDIGLFSRIIEGKIGNLILDNVTLKSYENSITIGLIAGYIQESDLNDIHIVNSNINSEEKVNNVGIIAGYVKNSTLLNNLNVSGSQLNVEMANNIGSAFGLLTKSSAESVKLNNNTLISYGESRASLGGAVGKLDNGILYKVNSSGNAISAPNAEKGEGGVFIGKMVKGQLINATSDTDYFDVPGKTKHWHPAMAAGFISGSLSPALMDINISGNHTDLDWYNSDNPVTTVNLTRD